MNLNQGTDDLAVEERMVACRLHASFEQIEFRRARVLPTSNNWPRQLVLLHTSANITKRENNVYVALFYVSY